MERVVGFGIQEWNLVIHTAFGIAGLLSVGLGWVWLWWVPIKISPLAVYLPGLIGRRRLVWQCMLADDSVSQLLIASAAAAPWLFFCCGAGGDPFMSR